MKNYLKFNLKGEKLFPIWFLIILLICVPIFFVLWQLVQYNLIQDKKVLQLIPLVLLFLILPFLLYFYVAKMFIESFEYNGVALEFSGTFKEFAKLFFKGLLLSIITLGVYIPWFIKNMQKFFLHNSSYEGYRPEFLGKGFKLFLIITFLAIVPGVVLNFMQKSIVLFHTPLLILFISGLVLMLRIIIMMPFYYYCNKWNFDARFKGLSILWNTETWDAILEMLKQSLLMLFTIGVYYPVGYLRIYKYFAERTVAVNENENYHLGYDLEPMADFKFIWGQILLTIISLGIYFPWAYCKVISRVVGKTYIIKN